MPRLQHLDCGNLTAKQRDDLSQSYAGDIGASLGHSATLTSLSGTASKVTLTPAGGLRALVKPLKEEPSASRSATSPSRRGPRYSRLPAPSHGRRLS